MKEVPRISFLATGSIIGNSILLLGFIFVFVTRFADDGLPLRAITFSIMEAGYILSSIYAVQLLVLRRKYYRYSSTGTGVRAFLRIVRIIQLLFTTVLSLVLLSVGYDTFKTLGASPDIGIIIVMLLLLTVLACNFILFFKGGRLLKQTSKNYLDEVMASFDNADLPKQ